jgi:alginate O-acetyltransferase complex protein AlgJ
MSRMTEAEHRIVHQPANLLHGKDGWLFLDTQAEQVTKQHTGELQLSEWELRQWRLVLESRAAWLEKLGIPYLFMVAPDPQSVYPEKLPDSVRPAAKRPVLQLLEHLRATESFAPLAYPLDDLLEEKRRRLVYIQTDSHWNFLGAFIAYKRLIRELGSKVPVRELSEQEVVFEEVELVGGLGYKVQPNRSSPHVVVTRMPKAARAVKDNCILNDGWMIELENSEAPPSTCLLLGDSYSVNLLLYLGESFGRLVYAHTPQLDFDLVFEYEPDVVISLLGERFIVTVPYDLPQYSVAEMARDKQRDGEVRNPLAWWG